jgi:hypothetical protein
MEFFLVEHLGSTSATFFFFFFFASRGVPSWGMGTFFALVDREDEREARQKEGQNLHSSLASPRYIRSSR